MDRLDLIADVLHERVSLLLQFALPKPLARRLPIASDLLAL
jgi:hypothetical protein